VIFPLQPLLDGWRRLSSPGLIRLVLLDIDGCLTLGEASPLNFPFFQKLQELNRCAAEDPAVPGLTLCSGRAEPYVELLTQAIGGYLPAIWENGAGLFIPAEYRFALNPMLHAGRLEAFEQARRFIADAVLGPGLARPQPGKEVSISLYPTDGTSVEQVYAVATRALEPLAGQYWVQAGLTCVEVLPDGIHKGTGVRWLLEELDLDQDQALAVGDAPGDLEVFSVTGLGATPSNGDPTVKAVADYVAPRAFGEGVLDIIDWCIARNRAPEGEGSEEEDWSVGGR
jgi:HAD superfamily hydrolase (TIGR01484 family)